MLAYTANLSDAISHQRSFGIKDLFLIGTSSVLIALCASISIKIPFTPVPLALAPHLCLALGLILGSKRGALAVLAYLIQGVMGLPVFALGDSGLLHLFGPRGGYLLGYAVATYVAGHLSEGRLKNTKYGNFLALATGNCIIYLLGVLQLSVFIGFQSAISLGIFPFLTGDLIKIFAVYGGLTFLRCSEKIKFI